MKKKTFYMGVFTKNLSFSIQSCRSCYATQHLCQCSFYKIFVKFRNSKKNVLKSVLIIVNINKDENKSLISNQFSLKTEFWSFLTFNFCLRKIFLQEVGEKLFLRENWFEMSDLFSSLLIFTIIKTLLSTFFLLFLNFTKIL